MDARRERNLMMLLAAVLLGALWWSFRAPDAPRNDVRVLLDVRSNTSDTYHLFYDTLGTGYTDALMAQGGVQPSELRHTVEFRLPALRTLRGLRLDPGGLSGPVDLLGLRIEGPYHTLEWDHKDLLDRFEPMHHIDTARSRTIDDAWRVVCTGNDPYLATRADVSRELAPVLGNDRPVVAPLLKAIVVTGLLLLLLRMLLRVLRTMRVPRIRWQEVVTRPMIVVLLAAVALYALVSTLVARIAFTDRSIELTLAGTFRHADEAQVYYAVRPGAFTKERYAKHEVPASPLPQLLRFTIPADSAVKYIRLDPGSRQDTVWLDSLVVRIEEERHIWDAHGLKDLLDPNEQIGSMELVDGRLRLVMQGGDPFLSEEEDLTPTLARLRRDTGRNALSITAGLVAVLFFLLGSGGDLARRLRAQGTPSSDLVLGLLFTAAIGAPGLVMLTGSDPQLKNTEKRELAQVPRYSLERLAKFPTEYTVYFSENFGLRKLLFRWNALTYVYGLHASPLPDRVFFGKGDWMFYVRDGALEQYQDLCQFPEEKAARIARTLVERRDWLRAQGIHYVLMIPPEKSSIYPEKLPSRIHRFGLPSCLDQFLAYLRKHTDLDVVDVRDELKAMKAERDVYYTTDIHWNPIGGYIGYKGLMEHIHRALPSAGPPVPFASFTIDPDTNDAGDLALQIGVNDLLTRVTPMLVPATKPKSERLPPDSYHGSAFFKFQPVIDQVADTTKPRLLMWRDSFAVYMIPHLSEHFSRSVYIWTPIFLHEIVQQEHPDVVVQEIMELFLNDLERDNLPLPPLPPPPAPPPPP